ncbi:hypothetical protein T492DRAFT_885907 [Pavlovales sp. CCMP2436]|nr:hypothetical protein T492DRAFT_885907 [Pavlovales sp. CCMP2436]
MAYLLRHTCELVSGESAPAKTRHSACQLAIDNAALQRFGTHDEDDLRYIAVLLAVSREMYHFYAYGTLMNCATSKASRHALYAALNKGLYFLLDRTNNMGGHPPLWALPCTWKVKRFVLASPRGDLVAFYSSEMCAYTNGVEDDNDKGMAFEWPRQESLTWKLHATVVGVADEPRMAEAMRGSVGLRGQQLLAWFDGLLLGRDPHALNDSRSPSPPPSCSEPMCLVDCKASMSPGFLQSIKPPLSPAAVSSLIDSLGLGKAVHPDDLLLALLVISGMAYACGHRAATPHSDLPLA